MNFTGFVGGSDPSASRTVNYERTINLIVESEAGTPKRKPVLFNRWATTAYTMITPLGGPIRAMFHQDGRFFAVSGEWFYEIFQSRNVVVRGQMTADSRSATICSNGRTAGGQLFITSGGNGYIFELDSNSFAQITDTDLRTPIWGGAFLDSYFLALNVNSNTFQLSKLLDGTSWSGLDIAQTNQSSDAKIAMLVSNRKLWLFGTLTTEVWYDSGDASFPLQPYLDSVIQHGIAAPYSAQALDNTVYFLGQDTQGRAIVWRMNGYTPERISTHAIEYQLQALPQVNNIVAFSLQLRGHAFYALYSPLLPTTLMFDIGNNEWSEWSVYDEKLMRHVPWIGRCQAQGWNKQFIGDRQSGCIYTLDENAYDDFNVWWS